MDVVYVCSESRSNEELRFSLRSLRNLPHDRVWIAGGWPPFVRDVARVPVPRTEKPYAQTTKNLLAVCAAGVSDEFVFLNDDIFVMHPVDEVPTLYRGRIADVAHAHANRPYAVQMRRLAAWLLKQGCEEPLSYELHTPMILNRERLVEALAMPAPKEARDTHKRSLYGNVWGIGGAASIDCKVGREGDEWAEDWLFLSTKTRSFVKGSVGRHIRAAFVEPGPYETP